MNCGDAHSSSNLELPFSIPDSALLAIFERIARTNFPPSQSIIDLVLEAWEFCTVLMHWVFAFLNGLGIGVLAMLLHEAGHIAAALALGVRVKNVGIQWNKGLYTVRESGSCQQNLLIALAGPFVNLLLVATEPWLPVFSMANFCYALANMLPIEGSDGFRVAACWRNIREGHVVGKG